MTNSNPMTKKEFLEITLNQVSQSYVGMDKACRCGCKGEYTATSYHNNPRSEVNDQLNLKRLQKAKRLVQSGAKYEIGSNNINVVTGDNRALTIYFDEVKKVVPVLGFLKGEVILSAEDCNSEAEFHDLHNLKDIIETENQLN